ncbi:MAG: TlpA family protein disulfide reductase [Planctomycetaceae bacterium]|nr:TlpA family protein disulfide reductase [Planctomycetaceae bacterium]
MFSPTLALAAALALVAAGPVEPGTQLTYSGTMSGVKDDGNPAVKEFMLALVAIGGEGESVDFAWALDETGRGGWTWLDHFGKWTVTPNRIASDAPSELPSPALLYVRAEGKSIVPLIPPLPASPKPLEAGSVWSEGRLEHRVTGEAAKSGRMCWEIDVRSPYGHKRTLWIDKSAPLVVAVKETVFIGQGEEHKLQFELTEVKQLAADETAKIAAALDAWVDLRKSLAWEPRSRREELSTEQIASLKAGLPKIVESAALGPLAAIAAAAQRDAAGQKNRAGAVAALADAIVGQPLGDMQLTDLSGKPLADDSVKGKVVVLHFWEYRDTPLEEPYGQVGYLDFLLRRRPETVVIGVHVDPRLADESTRRASLAGAKKLKAFMNLSYAIAHDDGSLLKRLGDPRVAGGKLPLFVVVGKDGKIAAYHAGLYEVKATEGLAELEAEVKRLLTKE